MIYGAPRALLNSESFYYNNSRRLTDKKPTSGGTLMIPYTTVRLGLKKH